MGYVKTMYDEIWKLEKEILEAEADVDHHRKTLEKASESLGPLWKEAMSKKEVSAPIQKAFETVEKLVTKELPANIAKAQKRYDDKRAMQRQAGITLCSYITKKLDRARPGQILPKKVEFYTRLAEEMRHNFR